MLRARHFTLVGAARKTAAGENNHSQKQNPTQMHHDVVEGLTAALAAWGASAGQPRANLVSPSLD